MVVNLIEITKEENDERAKNSYFRASRDTISCPFVIDEIAIVLFLIKKQIPVPFIGGDNNFLR